MHTHSLPMPPPLPRGPAAGETGLAPSLDQANHFDPLAPVAFTPEFEVAPARIAPGPSRSVQAPGRVSVATLAWGLAATAAAAYLSVIVFRPDLVARVEPGGPAVAEIEALRGQMDDLRRDLAEVRSSMTETASQQKVIFDRLAEFETAKTMPASEPGGAGAGLRLEGVPVNGGLPPNAEAPPATEPAPKVAEAKILNGKPALETGSVKPTPPAPPAPAAKTAAAPAEPPPFSAPVVTPSAKPIGVQIASGSSIDSLRLSWSLLSETHADKLKSLEPRYSLSVDNGAVVYNLLAGPVKSEAEAKKMCKALAAKAVPCKVVGEFGGAAL